MTRPSILTSFLVGAPILVLGLATTGCETKTIDLTGPEIPPGQVSYSADIQPLFNNSCGGGGCHIERATNGVRLSSYDEVLASEGLQYGAPIITPGDPSHSASPLIDKVNPSPEHGQRMPLDRDPLSSTEIAMLRSWIEAGAPDN